MGHRFIRWNRSLSAVAAGLVALTLALPASAEPSAADKESARALVAKGQSLTEAKDFAGALKAFQAAHAIMGLPTTGVPLGKTQIELGLLVEARDTLLGVTRYPKKPDEPEPFARARAEAADLAEKIAPRIATLELSFPGLPPSASVSVVIDGVAVPAGAETAPRRVNPGAHKLEARAEGYEPATLDLKLEPSETRQLAVPLTKAGVAAAATPVTAPLPVTPPPAPTAETRTSPLVYVGFGAAGAGLVAGSITGLMAMSSADAARDNCEGNRCRPAAQDDIDKAKTFGLVSTIGFGVALVGAGVGIYGLLAPSKVEARVGSTPANVSAPRRDAASARITVRPVVGPASLHVVGSF